MPNDAQPQGLTKTVINPEVNTAGKYVIDFDMPEDNGIATASHLALIINDTVARADIDVVFNPALLRTRFDTVHIEVVSDVATNLNIYTLQTPDHVADYTTAPKRILAIAANESELFSVKKLANVIVFDGAAIDRLVMPAAPENGGGTEDIPQKEDGYGTGGGTT
ncbi:hypothetical protein [Psychrobacter sp. 72-O-c]|uniref:hypothetical protein n=1 Tax=Psychrobacter sp. 72-O-c TaxID=2774125 RepID=UPI00191B73EA|nr:hypothetical protein [Psychrobacter sp. 72-O-c]